MKNLSRVALVGAGNFSDSPLSRIPDLAQHLGPVKAPSFRLASRLSNTLRGGHAVNHYTDLAASPLILLSVPDPQAPAFVAELAASGLAFRGKSVVICGERLTAASLDDLSALGSATGSFCSIPGFEDTWFLLEGGKVVERQMRPLFKNRGMRVTVVAEGSKAAYLAGMDQVGSAFAPQVKDALECLRAAGIKNSEAFRMLEKQAARTLRSCFRSGKI